MSEVTELKAMQESYFRLPADANGGQRYRAYRSYSLTSDRLEESAVQRYSQSKEYNYLDGGKVRTFQPIEPQVSRSPILQRVIATDAAIVKATGVVSFDAAVKVGVHQVRYQPMAGVPSYSSPPWLHKDDEPAVFVHLLNLSANLSGGDSCWRVAIATSSGYSSSCTRSTPCS
ncbi:2OG-Fe dioxygenase family protein [Bradyrhizobium sp. 182]|uniref:2OG-Fe dioxygenase family protein n=1 Tax=Bradyrhizobium sp. 182 TaxID=2782651 RepID=UPI001FF80468|nr:2OG-Fe dioxygenase family protein [Bradyrhizobium sp. 182]MCK1526219.1 2OG-Fe dioxygenase family protein [Bradyrhizobium sp. 182]